MKTVTDEVGERNYNECYEATQAFKKAFEMYIKQLKKYNDDMESYKRWKKEWNNWKTRSGNYTVYRNHGVNEEFWASDQDGTCWWGENWNSAHQWCHNMASSKGRDGENYWARKWGMCNGRHGNFLCAKPDDIVTKQLVEYANAEPKTDPQNGKQNYWLGIAEPTPPQPPSGNNIMCCSQLFKDISVTGDGNVDFSNVIQTCLQKISTKLTPQTAPHATAPPPQPQSSPHTSPTPPTPPPQNSWTSTKLWMIIVLVIFIVGVLASSGSSLLGVK